MSVYVDNFYETGITFRGMKMSHLIADTQQELFDMVDKIGVQRKWVQHYKKLEEHFDICFSKRELAIKAGAVSINIRDYATMIRNRIKTGNLTLKPINNAK